VLRPALVAVVAVAALTGAGFAVQAVALPQPRDDDLLAARTLHRILLFRVVRSTQHVPGTRPLRAICLDGWFRSPRRRRVVRGAVVLLGDGRRLYNLGHGVRIGPGGARASELLDARFVLAGCPRFVARRLGDLLSRALPVDAQRGASVTRLTYAFGRNRVTLAVESKSLTPAALFLRRPSLRGWSQLRPGGDPALFRAMNRNFAFLLPGSRPRGG
jgi:hypothetical protein